MNQRYQQVKDELMYIISLSPQAMHSASGMHDRLKDKVTRTEIERGVACLLSRQHIKKLGAHVFGIGTGEGIKPYSLENHDPDALKSVDKPQTSNKDKIRHGEQKLAAGSKKKSLKDWAGGEKQKKQANTLEKDEALAKAVPGAKIRAPYQLNSTTLDENGKPEKHPSLEPNKDSDINYALLQLEKRLVTPPCPQVHDLHIKVNVLDSISRMVDPTLGGVLEEIIRDLKGEAA